MAAPRGIRIPLPRDHEDEVVCQHFDEVQRTFGDIVAQPMLKGRLVNVTFVSGADTPVRHGLPGRPAGAIPVMTDAYVRLKKVNPPTGHVDSADTLWLRADNDANVSLWVFQE